MRTPSLQKVFLFTFLFVLLIGCTEEESKTYLLPYLNTDEISQISYSSASCGGYIFSDRGLPVTARGICWSLHTSPTISDSLTLDGSGTGGFLSQLRNLIPDTTYFVRAYATNSDGTGYGEEQTFHTMKTSIPVLTTRATPTSNTSLLLGGSISLSGGSKITAKGVYWSESPNPTASNHVIDLSSGEFLTTMSGLISGVSYYFKAYATNTSGTAYGKETKVTMPISDVEGHIYHLVSIGTQTWMVENLRTSKFRDSVSIANKDYENFMNSMTPAWCDFTKNAGLGAKYGHLYNWYAVNDSLHILAPDGWHVATDEEWTTLTDYLGGPDVAGGKLKEAGTGNWNSPNTGATNSSGFTALPGGWTYYLFFNMNTDAVWWTYTGVSEFSAEAWNRSVYYNSISIFRESVSKNFGLSVRCVRDK
jgi:uncharacterized protein (TIGR02145 family)